MKIGDRAFKSRQEHVDEKKSKDEKWIEEKIMMMRKKLGMKNQRRARGEECSAPKRRRIESDRFKEARCTTGDKDIEEKIEKRKCDVRIETDENTKKKRKINFWKINSSKFQPKSTEIQFLD